ncbi:MAG: hypothetical protein AB8I08_27215 [Sandaracinaceae bacterium]
MKGTILLCLLLGLLVTSVAAAQIPAATAQAPTTLSLRIDGDDAVDSEGSAYRVVDRADANGDGQLDLIVAVAQTCGNYGHCEMGMLVWEAADRYRIAIPIDYRYDLGFAPTTTRVGRVRFRDLIEDERVGGSQLSETALMSQGLDPVLSVVWRAGPDGYRAPRHGVLGVYDECVRARVQRRGDARRWCSTALRNAVFIPTEAYPGSLDRSRLRGIRSAALYQLGRIEEARGEHAPAREHYRESLRLRPRREVSERLRSL